MKKIKKKHIIIPSTILFLLLGGLTWGGNYLYNFALNPIAEKDVFDTSSSPVNETETSGKIDTENSAWLSETAVKVSLTSFDRLRLNGYEVVNASDHHKYAIIVHGYKSAALHMSNFAKHFYDLGYHILVPDLRGHGASEGDYIGMGWHDRLDLLDWVNTIIEKDPSAEIVLFGISMGAATVMMASGEDLPTQVKAVIEDCGYTSVWDQFAKELKNVFHLPTFPLLNVASLVTNVRAGYGFKEASALEQIKKSTTPTLFIHGDADTFVPFSMLDELYNAAPCEKEKLVIEGAEHAFSSTVNPDLYWNTVYSFLEKYVP